MADTGQGWGLSDYQAEWPRLFLLEKANLEAVLGHRVTVIEHVGSTAVPGLRAKPVIDVFVAVAVLEAAEVYLRLLGGDYEVVNTGMPGRWLLRKSTAGRWTHNVHFLPHDAGFANRNELLFRDYLREHPESVEEYARLKSGLFSQGLAGEAYNWAKTDFVQRVVDAARDEKGLARVSVWEKEERARGK